MAEMVSAEEVMVSTEEMIVGGGQVDEQELPEEGLRALKMIFYVRWTNREDEGIHYLDDSSLQASAGVLCEVRSATRKLRFHLKSCPVIVHTLLQRN